MRRSSQRAHRRSRSSYCARWCCGWCGEGSEPARMIPRARTGGSRQQSRQAGMITTPRGDATRLSVRPGRDRLALFDTCTPDMPGVLNRSAVAEMSRAGSVSLAPAGAAARPVQAPRSATLLRPSGAARLRDATHLPCDPHAGLNDTAWHRWTHDRG
jgi:hypothetical protein